MDPVELKIQVLILKGSTHAEAYADAVETWSADKITVKIRYSGRWLPRTWSPPWPMVIDIGPLYRLMAPDKVRVQGVVPNFVIMNDSSPGRRHAAGRNSVDGGRLRRADRHRGLGRRAPTAPARCSSPCPTPSAPASERSRRSTARRRPPSEPARRQRCGGEGPGRRRSTCRRLVTGRAVPLTFSLAEVTDAWMVEPSVHFTGNSETLAAGDDTWDDFPLAGRQFVWDKFDDYLASDVKKQRVRRHDWALAQAEKHGVEVEALRRRRYEDPHHISGYDDVNWEDFRHGKAGKIDLQPVVDKIVEDVLTPR